jgi:hypothetical protein
MNCTTKLFKEIARITEARLLSKVDIEHALAYKIIPINPASFHLLGFVIGDKYFFDKTLPMGLSYSCNLFEQFSCATQLYHNAYSIIY